MGVVTQVTAAGRPAARVGATSGRSGRIGLQKAPVMLARVFMWMFVVMLGVAYLMETPTPLAIAP